ncbi:DMT family transporter [Micromonospora sp. CPCC 206060]|uniref:DMT family transporter n=1 Tax=Micromonospora sp. CPCC 206060 TaxID=3122406 RepID=UPI002FF0085C
MRRRPARRSRPSGGVLPGWLALGLVVLGGVASAAQGLVNAELGERVGNPTIGAVVNNLGGCLLIGVGLLLARPVRAALAGLRHAGLPWWAYLGGLGGAVIVVVASYVVPVLGVALFTIAQVAGSSFGGLAVDRTGLAPTGRLALTPARVTGALLGIGAVALAQTGRPLGELAVAPVLLAVAGGIAVAGQAALNGRVGAAVGGAAATVVNFAVGTPAILAVAALAGAFGNLAGLSWPAQPYLYLGGLCGVAIVAALLVGVRSVGVLRTGLALVAGQLAGALLLDAVVPTGPGPSLPVLAGAVLTLVAVLVAGIGRRARPEPVVPAEPVEPDGRLVG